MLIINSHNISLFRKRLQKYTSEILENELGIEVGRSRFKLGNYFYPLTSRRNCNLINEMINQAKSSSIRNSGN